MSAEGGPGPQDGEIEELRSENARLRAALAEAESRSRMLRAELRHGVRNALASVECVVRRTARTSDSLEDYVSHLEGRVAAIVRSHAMAAPGTGRGGIALDYLLAEELLAQQAREGEQVQLSGPAVQLRGAGAVLLGLAFHELAVNSLKFGALSGRGGRIAIDWTVEPGEAGQEPAGDFLRLDWVETGGPAPDTLHRRDGFGTQLIRQMVEHRMGGEASLNFLRDGLHCTVMLPLAGDVSLAEGDGAQDDADGR